MKNIKYIIAVFALFLSANLHSQTPFPSGIRFPNLKQVTSGDSISVIGANGVLKSWIHKDSIASAKNLQAVTDVGYTTTNPLVTSSYLQSGLEITVPNQKKYLDVLRTSDGNSLITYQTEYWNIGNSALDLTSNVFIGKNAGLNSRQNLNNGFGENALSNNTGSQSNGFGNYALSANKGNGSNGFGYFSLVSNTGVNSNGFGNLSLYNNKGNHSSGFGNLALQYNMGHYSNGFSANSLSQNLGNNANGFGYQSLQYNDRNDNTAVGHMAFSDFYDDIANKKDFLPENVQIGTKNITVTNHGFIPNNGFVNLRYTTTGTPITGLSNNRVYQIEVLNSNLLAIPNNITSQGTGIHTFTPQYQYTNSTTIGANSHPTDSNQITLGDPNVTEIDTYGRHRSRAYGQGHVTGAPTYNLAVDSAGRFIETAMGGGGAYLPLTGGTLTGELKGTTIAASSSDASWSHLTRGVANTVIYNYQGTTGRLFAYDGVVYYDLAIGNWNAGNPNIMLKKNGNVGINLGNPSQKLDVAGNVKADKFIKSDGLSSEILLANGDVRTLTDFTRTNSGTVPAPTGSTTNRVLHEDGTWKVPAGGGQKEYKIISTATYTLLPEDNGKVLLFTYYEDNDGWIYGDIFLTINNTLPSNFDCEVHSANGSDILVNDIDDPLVDFGPRPDASIDLYLNGASKGQGRIIKLTGNRVYTTGFEWLTGG